MRFLVIFSIVAFLALSANADTGFTLRTVNTHKKYDFGVQYVAIGYQLRVPAGDYYVEGINATNVQGLTNDDVRGLHIVHQFTRFLPHKVLQYFKNINHYHVVDSGLVELGNEQLDGRIRYVHFDDNEIRVVPKTFFANTGDMELISFERNRIETLDGDLFRGMPKLKYVSFAGNRIRTLPGTLFSTNTKLECISFENNGLTRIGTELVRELESLKGVSFDGNVCINSAYWNEPNMRDGLTSEFTAFCDGRCETVNRIQTDIERMQDKVWKMQEKFPKCSLKNFFWYRVHSLSSDENDLSEDNDESGKKKNPHASMCPYAEYSATRRN